MGRGWVLGGWVAMIGLVTLRQVSTAPGLPQPGAYLGSGIVYTMLYVLAFAAPQLAGTLAIATVLGGLAAPYLKGQPGLLDQASTWLSNISGGTPQQAPGTPGLKFQPGTPGQ